MILSAAAPIHEDAGEILSRAVRLADEMGRARRGGRHACGCDAEMEIRTILAAALTILEARCNAGPAGRERLLDQRAPVEILYDRVCSEATARLDAEEAGVFLLALAFELEPEERRRTHEWSARPVESRLH